MIKDILREKEEVVYYSLLNAIKNDRLARMILLSGPKNPLKLKTAYLLAQTIVEGKGDFACEECETCRRIERNEYLDMIYIDGRDDAIGKDDIDKMFKRFKETAVESFNKKIFIINDINNSSVKVLNMILKFIEEPKDNVYGIFITDELDSLLDTIKSRCQIIPFREISMQDVKDMYINDGFDTLDAYLLTSVFGEYRHMDLNDELYLAAKDMAIRTLDLLDNPELLEIEFSNNLYVYKDKKLKTVTEYYLEMMVIFISDSYERQDDKDYQKILDKLDKYQRHELLDIFIEARDNTKYSYDRKLMLDSIAYKTGNIV